MGSSAFPETSDTVFLTETRDLRAMSRRTLPVVFWPGCALVLLVCGLQAAAWQLWPAYANAIGYGCFGFSLWACAAACMPFVRAAEGYLRVRWSLFFAAVVTAACCYSMVTIQHLQLLPVSLNQPNTVALGDISEALYLLAATLLFSGASKSIAAFDAMQAILFALQRFLLTYVTTTKDHFSTNHLAISQSVGLFLFVAATLAGAGAASGAERRFLKLLSWFLVLRLVGMVCADQISYVWLHHLDGSYWDIPHVVLMGGFAVFLVVEYRRPRGMSETSMPAYGPSMTTRNMMPSMLALANLGLGFCVLYRSAMLAVLSIVTALTLYVLRTVLLQSQMDRDSAKLQRRNRQLESLAGRDALTGAGNRRSLGEAYGRVGGACTLLMIDVDYFKQANDRFGHLHGDRVLAAVATVLRGVEAEMTGSHCARFGGDEFALLLPGVGGLRVAEGIRDAVAAMRVDGAGVSVSVGGGVAQDARGMGLEELIGRADKALYRAKVCGRNRVEMDGVLELQEAS